MRIFFLDDVLRDEGLPARDFFYEIVEAAVRYHHDVQFLYPPRKWRPQDLSHSIGTKDIYPLLNETVSGSPEDARRLWATNYRCMPSGICDLVLSALGACDLVIGYEMAPWLTDLMRKANLPFINIRLSPYRFGRDLYVAMSSAVDQLRERMSVFMMREADVRFEARLLAASSRHSRRFSKNNLSMSGTVIFIGQTECDASLINSQNQFATIADYEPEIVDFCRDKRVLYKGHPYAGDHANRQQQQLEDLLEREVRHCPVDAYEILSADDGLSLIGLSSGMLQESIFFNKPARQLLAPICNVVFEKSSFDRDHYIQVTSGTFLAPDFWKYVLAPDVQSLPMPERSYPVQHNHLRELHNAWWGYSEHFAKSHLYRDAIKWNELMQAS